MCSDLLSYNYDVANSAKNRSYLHGKHVHVYCIYIIIIKANAYACNYMHMYAIKIFFSANTLQVERRCRYMYIHVCIYTLSLLHSYTVREVLEVEGCTLTP